jgi:SAM-dependent methyltransferase
MGTNVLNEILLRATYFKKLDDLYLNSAWNRNELEIYESFSPVEKNTDFYNKFGYGEITRDGVESFYKEIKSKKDITNNDVFLDIGSGNGKMVLHLSMISEFGEFIGVELQKIRHEYSKHILKDINNVNVKFINDDIRNFDLSKVTVIFMNDVLFEKEDVDWVFDNIKSGTHIISFEQNDYKALDEVYLKMSWQGLPVKFNYYIK